LISNIIFNSVSLVMEFTCSLSDVMVLEATERQTKAKLKKEGQMVITTKQFMFSLCFPREKMSKFVFFFISRGDALLMVKFIWAEIVTSFFQNIFNVPK
jgi:hypothetical protein